MNRITLQFVDINQLEDGAVVNAANEHLIPGNDSLLNIKKIILIFCFCLTASVGLTARAEFKNILAVDSLEGWESIGMAKWTVNKGILTGGQNGDSKRWGYLQTKRKYKNFELQLDFKIDEYGKYNSGVYLLNPRTEKLAARIR